MQSYKLAPSKVNSKACDQCYRCKVKCTMEQKGCARCQTTNSVCTYSLGKWMERPKGSSKAGTTSRTSGVIKSANSASSEGSKYRPNRVPEEHQHWELFPAGIEDFPQSSSDATALLPFPMDEFSQSKTNDYATTGDNSMNVASSTFRIGASNRNTPQTGIESLNTASSLDFQQVNTHKHRDNSHSQPLHTPSSQQDFGFGSIEIHASSLPSPGDTTDPFPIDYVKVSNERQASPIRQELSLYQEDQPWHCNCSQAALACLDKVSTIPSEARYKQHLETIQSAFLTAEKLGLCTTCTPNMIIARCFLVMGNAHELTTDLSSQLDEAMNNTTATRQVKEDIKRVKRRAAMLFAGLRMLQDLESGE